MTKSREFTGADSYALRKRLNLNQSQFWHPLGVTNSGGSRYENGRKIPRPVQILLTVAYGPPKQSEAAIQALRKRD